jgi:hypothetical protein
MRIHNIVNPDKQTLKGMLIIFGSVLVQRADCPSIASKFADKYACACKNRFAMLTEQDELDISDAVWSCSSTNSETSIVMQSFL